MTKGNYKIATIYIPKDSDLLELLASLQKKMGRSRSDLAREALEDLLEKYSDASRSAHIKAS